MKIIKLNVATDREKILQQIGSTQAGLRIMRDKMGLNFFYLKGIKTPAANILKQDALSIGADLAVEKNTILCQEPTTDALLIATDKQLKILSQKEKAQPFGLKAMAEELALYLPQKRHSVSIMGVLNANDDSFYKDSRFSQRDALFRVEQMLEEGADIVDIGAVSSRPGSESVREDEELERIAPIIDALYDEKLYEQTTLSLDSYQPKVVEYALSKGFHIINDITALRDDAVAKLVASYHAKVVLMHMQGMPKDMQKNPHYKNVLVDVADFFHKRIKKAEQFGIQDIVLDVGIGFGKRLEDNLQLIQHMGHFNKFGKELLIGASRKSLIDNIISTPIEERLAGTLVLHLKAVEEGASIVRCHDVKEHRQALKVFEALVETTL